MALERVLEILGEAATRLSPEFRDRHPEVEWRQIIGMRNVLPHGYDIVRDDVLWDTVERDLPKLLLQIEAIECEFGAGEDKARQ